MPVHYQGSFWRILCRWRGSVWKSVWKELIWWLVAYYIIRVVLLYGIPHSHHESAKNLVKLFDIYLARIPLEFLLGFFVTTTVTRWWNQAMLISPPTALMGTIAGYVHALDEESRYIRHTVARYIVLSYALGYRSVSSKLKRVFVNNEKFVKIGLMTREESEILGPAPLPVQYEIPLQWITELVRSKVGCHQSIMTQLNSHRSNMSVLAKYDSLVVPLVYAQTVTVIVYGYFIFGLIGHQFYYVEPKVDLVVPVFTILRFISYVGWLKVAEELAKPWGDDDADIDLCATLATFSDIAFTIADYAPDRRPTWSPNYEENGPKTDTYITKLFRDNTTKYNRLGKSLTESLQNLLSCKRDLVEPEEAYCT